MSKTATLVQDGLYDLSEPLEPFADGMSFTRLALHLPPNSSMWLMGVGADGQEHPTPLLPTQPALTPAAAMAALGYALA